MEETTAGVLAPAPGDFAMAYVIAHEVGHHVQNQLGIMEQVMSLQERMSEREFNQVQVRLELQADFLAGVWAHHAQRMTQGSVVPDSFTHGTSEQRTRWFIKGLRSGDISQGDTFTTNDL